MPRLIKNLKDNHKFSLEGLRKNGVSAEDAADFLNLIPESVTEYYSELQDNEEKEKGKLINTTATGSKGVSIMTAAGSQRIDQLRTKKKAVTKSPSVHKISDG